MRGGIGEVVWVDGLLEDVFGVSTLENATVQPRTK